MPTWLEKRQQERRELEEGQQRIDEWHASIDQRDTDAMRRDASHAAGVNFIKALPIPDKDTLQSWIAEAESTRTPYGIASRYKDGDEFFLLGRTPPGGQRFLPPPLDNSQDG
jgi:hypothetical protein